MDLEQRSRECSITTRTQTTKQPNMQTNLNNTTTAFGQNAPQKSVTVEPTSVQRIEKPTVVHEKILPSQLTEVQPVVHIDREQTEVHKVVQPLKERDIAPTQVQHVQLPAQHLESRASDAQFQTQYRAASNLHSDTTVAPTATSFVERAPVVHENVHKRVVEEVQPVLYKETFQPTVIEAVKPIYENIVEAPILSQETLPVRDLGTKILPGTAAPYPVTQQFPVQQQVPVAVPVTQAVPVIKQTTTQTTTTAVTSEQMHHHATTPAHHATTHGTTTTEHHGLGAKIKGMLHHNKDTTTH